MCKTVILLFGVKIIALTIFLKAEAKLRLRYGQNDPLFVTSCEAKCWKLVNRNMCVKGCLAKGAKKPGTCPQNTTLSPFAAACIETCQMDSQCSGINKCCQHSCGVTCQPPNDLDSAVGIPEKPTDIQINECRRRRTVSMELFLGKSALSQGSPEKLSDTKECTGKRTVNITWISGKSEEDKGLIFYLIQERHHAGKHFTERRLSEWTPCFRTDNRNNYVTRHFMKPGRWYQLRVAAVNENGTKGYSESSQPFSILTSVRPKPKAPRNMAVGQLWTINGSINAELTWSPPPLDLPLKKYKVFWSRRLYGVKALDSVLVNQDVVSKDQNYFLLQNLQPNSLYFLQVQAVVQFGEERLKGEKSGLVLNTTINANMKDHALTVNPNAKSRIEDLHLQKLFWAQGGLRARITWKTKKGTSKYTVTWWTELCYPDSISFNNFKLSATTMDSKFDLSDLQCHCQYRVNVKEISTPKMKFIQDTSITFTTPKCNKFKSTHTNMN